MKIRYKNNKSKLLIFLLVIPFLSLAQDNSQFKSGTIEMGIVASDIATSLRFYTEIIGMQVSREFQADADFANKSGLTAIKGTIDVTVLKTINEENATELKLMTFNNKNTASKKHISDANGMSYITIFVKKIEPFVNRLKENNIPLLGETPLKLPNGKNFVLVQDPDGVFIELIGN